MARHLNAAVVVFDGIATWQVAVALASLRRAAGFRVLTIGFGHLPVLADTGMRVLPERTMDECGLEGVDVLVVPGGELWQRGPIASMTAFLHRARLVQCGVAAIGTGVVALANAGLLDARPHSSDGLDDGGTWLANRAPSYRGHVHHRPKPVTSDHDLITATGRSTIEFAAALLAGPAEFDPDQLDAWRSLHAHAAAP